jgi:hypothetical protein
MKRFGLAVAALGLLAAPAHAAPRFFALPSPLAPLSPSPPVGSGATASAEGVRHRITATARVRALVDPTGKPFRVRATQRLDVRVAGDYFFTISAPLTNVEAAPGSQATPGLRATSFLWEGFNPKQRLLAATAELEPDAVVDSLPLRIDVSGTTTQLVDTTVTTVPSFTADAPMQQLLSYLAGLRRAAATGVAPAGGGTAISSPLRPVRLRISVPLLVEGMIGTAHVRVILGGAGRALRASFGPGRIALTVRPLPPTELLAATRSSSGRALLKRASVASLEFARYRQYSTFLGNPDPVGKSTTTYVYRSGLRPPPATEPVAAAAEGRNWTHTALIALGALLALVAAAFAWSRA